MDVLKKMREAYLSARNPENIRGGALRYMHSGATDSSRGLGTYMDVLGDEFSKANKYEALQGAAKAMQSYDEKFKPGGKSVVPENEELENLYLKLLLSNK